MLLTLSGIKLGRQTRAEALWRTLIANEWQDRQPAPAEGLTYFCNIVGIWNQNLFQQSCEAVQEGRIEVCIALQVRARELVMAIASMASAEPRPSPFIDMLARMMPDFVPEGPQGEPVPIEPGTFMDFHQRFFNVCAGRRLFATRSRYLGVGSEWLRCGDEVWILAGAYVPFILRPLPNGRYQWIGEAYVHGVVQAEESWFETLRFGNVTLE